MRAILTFHGVDASGSVLSIAPDELRSLVRAIRRGGHEIVPLAELLDEGGADRVALTFDDGLQSLREHALPILRDEGAPATLFLTTSRVGLDNRWPSLPPDAPTLPMLDWDGVEALAAAGWAIEAHTESHPDLRTLDDAGVREEIERGNAAIQARLGARPTLFAYPYGFWDARVEAIAADYFRHSVTTDMGTLAAPAAPHRLPRLETFYFRAPSVHAHFGSALFDGYLWSRGLLRRLRH